MEKREECHGENEKGESSQADGRTYFKCGLLTCDSDQSAGWLSDAKSDVKRPRM